MIRKPREPRKPFSEQSRYEAPVAKPQVAKPQAIINSNYKESLYLSPNHGGKIRPQGLVLHHSCGSWEGDTSWITNPESKVSYHCLINTDGERRIFVPDDYRAWHCGKSRWQGRAALNGWTIGLAFTGDTNRRSLTIDEMMSALEYLRPLYRKWGWHNHKEWITDHRIVAYPKGRKDDLEKHQFYKISEFLKDMIDF